MGVGGGVKTNTMLILDLSSSVLEQRSCGLASVVVGLAGRGVESQLLLPPVI